jgi:DNA-directed RNA polymerase specialized sigma24 family protein
MTTLDGRALLQHGHSLACRFAGRVGLETAQDLGCEAMVRAVASPAPDGRMEPWLERIFHNLLIDRWRRQKPAPVTIDDLNMPWHHPDRHHRALASARERCFPFWPTA